MLTREKYQAYLAILEEELVPAMGCTEPIALAYAAAKAREVLGTFPEHVAARCSGNIIKNVKCVTIPNSGGLRGIEASVIMGLTAGVAELEMEVLSKATDADRAKARLLMEQQDFCRVEFLDSDTALHIQIELFCGNEQVMLEIKHSHTQISQIVKNGEILFAQKEEEGKYLGTYTDRSILNVEDIVEFANTASLEEVRELLDRQISCNMAIAEEGMTGKYGIAIGPTILETNPDCLLTRIKACTAAGSEARMSGCILPVIINSGSGNQGMAASIPVVVYGKEKGFSQEKIYRGLLFSNLLTIHQKTFIGRLSAFCGAVSASCASGAAFTYMEGGTLEQIRDTIVNTMADIPGIICDGAKPSCGAKIATGLDASMMAHDLAMRGRVYEPFTGILQEQIEDTISSVGYIGKVGMRDTDKEILRIMVK